MERLSWEQVFEARNKTCVFGGSTSGSPCHPWKALPWPTFCEILGKSSHSKVRKGCAEPFHIYARVLSLTAVQMSTKKIKKKTGRASYFPWYTLWASHWRLLPEMGWFCVFTTLPGCFPGNLPDHFQIYKLPERGLWAIFLIDQERKGHTDNDASIAQIPLLSLSQIIQICCKHQLVAQLPSKASSAATRWHAIP